MKKAKRILALLGVIFLIAMYVITLILGLTASPATQGMMIASLMCSIIIPIMFYGIILIARVLEGRAAPEEDSEQNK